MDHIAEEYANKHAMLREQEANNERQKQSSTEKHEEYQYLELLQDIIEKGHWEQGRNGKTKSLFGRCMRFSLENNTIPILTTKKTAWKTCLKELLWFIRGETDNRILKQQNVHIWDANGTREFLDSVGLTEYEEDELGCIYGWQWRHFNKPYIPNRVSAADTNDVNEVTEIEAGVDQLQQIITALKDPSQRTSRRLIMTAWNPCQLHQMALPPCHVICQFNVHDGNKLSCAMMQRSVDCGLGQPFNIASYSFLTHLLAKHCGLEASEFIYFMGNCHIYEEHMDSMKEQIQRTPFVFPTLHINQIHENINDYQTEDFVISDYKSHETLKMKMIA
jgi:thymidylate synthase